MDFDYTVYEDPWYGYRLGLAPTWRRGEYGKEQIAYYLDAPEGTRLFSGSDFYPAPGMAVDGKEAAASLLTFLTLQPGDTDDEYFDDYTPRQLDWCQSMGAQELACWAMEVEEGADWEPLDFTG